ncbi:MAG: DUF58 domain-containing protein [Chloroflexi bacterium]|nr:DUF58 domain-containing protein [Chloroflexota bacterium]
MTFRSLFRRLIDRLSRLWRMPHANGEARIEARLEARQPLWLVASLGLSIGYALWPLPLLLTGLVVLLSLLLIGWLWTRSLARQIEASRTLRYTAVQVGDELEEALEIVNRAPLPLIWAEVIDHSTAPGYALSGVYIVGGGGIKQWRVTTTCTQRGVFMLGPWELITGDPFGIFRVRQTYTQGREILVYPPLASLSPELLPRQRQVGDLQRLNHATHADTINMATTRPYLIGDPLRRVHWRTTARHNKLFVKVFEPEASSTVWLAPDLNANVHRGEGADSSLEKMIVLTASLAAHLLSERLAVGLLLDGQAGASVPPQSGEGHLWSILRALALAQAQIDRPFDQVLLEARSVFSPRDSIVVLTLSLDAQWPQALHLLGGNRFNFAPEAIVLDPASFGGEVSAADFVSLLREQGVLAQVVRGEDIVPISGAYGEVRRWEFQTLGTGRVFVRQTPRAA